MAAQRAIRDITSQSSRSVASTARHVRPVQRPTFPLDAPYERHKSLRRAVAGPARCACRARPAGRWSGRGGGGRAWAPPRRGAARPGGGAGAPQGGGAAAPPPPRAAPRGAGPAPPHSGGGGAAPPPQPAAGHERLVAAVVGAPRVPVVPAGATVGQPLVQPRDVGVVGRG